jgi:hypothetical protein
MGHMARAPSEYSPFSIKLFIHHKKKDIITDYVGLAQYIGDAGAVSDIHSWLFRNRDHLPLFLQAGNDGFSQAGHAGY